MAVPTTTSVMTKSVITKTTAVRSALRDRRGLRAAALIAVALFIGCGLWSLRWSGGRARATPDTFWYARDAFRYAGYSEIHADTMAARITCRSTTLKRHATYATCLRYRESLPAAAPIRFQRIFTSRPGYALLTVPFVRALGDAGFVLGSAALGVACGLAIVLLALTAGLRPMQAFLAEIMFYLLPTGLWVSRMLAEAPLTLCVLIALIGTIALVREHGTLNDHDALDGASGPTPAHAVAIGLLAVGLIGLCAVKPANGAALTAGLAAVAVARLPFRRARPAARPAHLLIAAVTLLVLTGDLLVGAALRLPGVTETLQDTFTHHFHHRDVAHPWQQLADLNGKLWSTHLGPLFLDHPLIPAAYLLAAICLFWRLHPDVALPLFVTGLTGAAVIAIHPMSTEAARLTEVTWIPVAIGLAAAVGPRYERFVREALPERRDVRAGDGAESFTS